jgi:site-specific DNA-methyltransferase (cytosine-N4-specific)
MSIVVTPPHWSLQPFERALLLREVVALSGTDASWDGDQVVIDASVGKRVIASLVERLALARSVTDEQGREQQTHQHRLEVGVGGGRRRKVTSHALHGLHPYKGKFYPQLARSILNGCQIRRGSRVLDPFAGCGTTLLEADLMRVDGLGLDTNPMAVLVANTKLRLLRRTPDVIHEALSPLRRLPRRGVPLPDPYLERWFPPRNLAYLLRALSGIRALDDDDARALALVCLSSVLRRCSFQDPNQMRVYKRSPGDCVPLLSDEFPPSLLGAIEILAAVQQVYSADGTRSRSGRVVLGDARELAHRTDRKFDALVTSPPYANALPYIDTDRLSLRAFGLLGDGGQRGAEQRLIGNREITDRELAQLNVEADVAIGTGALPEQLVDLIRQAREVAAEPTSGFRKRRTPGLLYAYFRDMGRVLEGVSARLASKAPAVFVVGDSTVAGPAGTSQAVPTADIITAQAARYGLELRERLGKRLTSYGASDTRHQRNAMAAEEVLVFQAA